MKAQLRCATRRSAASYNRGMKTFLALLLVVGSVVAYMVLAVQFGIYQRVPFVHIALALAGVVWLGVLLRQRFSWKRLSALAFATLLTGFYSWWTLVFSEYEVREHRAKAGEVLAALPELELLEASGSPTRLFTGKERATLVVFYRGFW